MYILKFIFLKFNFCHVKWKFIFFQMGFWLYSIICLIYLFRSKSHISDTNLNVHEQKSQIWTGSQKNNRVGFNPGLGFLLALSCQESVFTACSSVLLLPKQAQLLGSKHYTEEKKNVCGLPQHLGTSTFSSRIFHSNPLHLYLHGVPTSHGSTHSCKTDTHFNTGKLLKVSQDLMH